jgi:hypothetical protein
VNTYTDDELLCSLRRHLAAERWVEVAVLLEMLGAQSPELVEAIRDEITARAAA